MIAGAIVMVASYGKTDLYAAILLIFGGIIIIVGAGA